MVILKPESSFHVAFKSQRHPDNEEEEEEDKKERFGIKKNVLFRMCARLRVLRKGEVGA